MKKISILIILNCFFVLTSFSQLSTSSNGVPILEPVINQFYVALDDLQQNHSILIEEGFREKFVNRLKDAFTGANLTGSMLHEKVILENIKPFLKRKLVKNASLVKPDAEQIAKNLAYFIKLTLKRDEPIPQGIKRESIIEQTNQLISNAKSMISQKLISVDSEVIISTVDVFFGRILKYMDDPFHIGGKYLLNEDDINEVQEKWEEILKKDFKMKSTVFQNTEMHKQLQQKIEVRHLTHELYSALGKITLSKAGLE